MHHRIKIDEPYYDAVIDGRKRFEIRNNDRGYQAGDRATMTPCHHGVPVVGKAPVEVLITYVSSYGQKDNWVVWGFRLMAEDAA